MANVIGQEPEKGFAASKAHTADVRVAHLISVIGNPLFIALPLLLLVSVASAPTPQQGLLWWGITIAGISVVPFLFIRRGVKLGRYSDAHISVRSQRLVPLAFGLACMLLVFLLLSLLHASRPLLATLISMILALAIALGVTQLARYKVSLHMLGITGAVLACWLFFGPLYLLLSPLILLVGWARWKVRAHTPLQALLGALVAIVVTVLTFWLFMH